MITIRTHETINGYTIKSYRYGLFDAWTYFIQWMAGEYETESDAAAAALAGDLYDHGDSR
jgi:hypothetical protein